MFWLFFVVLCFCLMWNVMEELEMEGGVKRGRNDEHCELGDFW